MKIALASVVAVLGLSGCVSTTRSYDAQGRLLGSCEATRSFFLGNGGAVCNGSSNPKEQGTASGFLLPPPSAEPPVKCPPGESYKYDTCYPDKASIGTPK